MTLTALVMATLAGGSAASPGPEAPSEWLFENSGVLELRLTHREDAAPDGGVLRVDPNRRVVLWEGITGELGCKRRVEAAFDDIRRVRAGPDVGFSIEFKSRGSAPLVLMPLPHVAWLVKGGSKIVMGISPAVREMDLTGPDGARGSGAGTIPINGENAFSGPRRKAVALPEDVSRDIGLAVERIREALGRKPAPSIALYEALHGQPQDVTLGELMESPATFLTHAVRIRGTLELAEGQELRLSEEGAALKVVPLPELAALTQAEARDWAGQSVEVSGVLRRSESGVTQDPEPFVAFWECVGPEELDQGSADARSVSVAELLERPQELTGVLVHVVGQFRGRNLLHDRPVTEHPRSAWVIKAGRHALWVTGRKPVGRGFALRVDAREDTKNWLAVEGRLEVQEGVPVLRAATVALTSPAGGVQHAPRVIGNAGPPAVVFSMPIEGEPVAPDTRFVVQFSSYMDGDSFAERVRLRDSDTGQELSVGWSYDDTRRALIIQPRQALRPGARVELWLLSGITDADENPLASGAEGAPGASDVVQVLRWHVEG